MYFHYSYEPRISDYSPDGKITDYALLCLIEAGGNLHSLSVGEDIISMGNRGIAWIISEWRVRVIDRPLNGEALDIVTWVQKGSSRICSERCYKVLDKNKNLRAIAVAKLALIDVNEGKIMRLTPEFCDKYQPEEEGVFEERAHRMTERENYDFSTPVVIRRSDIDFNNHIHNTAYLTLLGEALTDELYKREYSEFSIYYRKSIPFGDSPVVKYTEEGGRIYSAIYSGDSLATLIELE